MRTRRAASSTHGDTGSLTTGWLTTSSARSGPSRSYELPTARIFIVSARAAVLIWGGWRTHRFLGMYAIRFPAFSMLTRGVLQSLKAKGATVVSKNGAQVLEKALVLPPDERAELAARLLSSLDTERQCKIDEMWPEEAEDRIDALERGEIRAVSVKEAFETDKGAKP